MFGVVKSFLANPLRVKANSFIENLDISNIKSKENQSYSIDTYNDIYNKAYNELVSFISNPSDESLFKSVLSGFEKCISLKPSYPESYFYLAYIFHICEENTLAIKYLNTVKFISPDFDELSLLEKDINKSLFKSNKIQEINKNTSVNNSENNIKKPEIKRIHYTDLKKKTI